MHRPSPNAASKCNGLHSAARLVGLRFGGGLHIGLAEKLPGLTLAAAQNYSG
jgi:hypothetical protein